MNSSVLDRLKAFHKGHGDSAWKVMGSHIAKKNGQDGVVFRVWAPNAASVSVVGDFNEWDRKRNPMRRRKNLGIWEAFLPDIENGAAYKYSIESIGGLMQLKSDPFAFAFETPPANASRVMDMGGFRWSDKRWLNARAKRQSHHHLPLNIYEVHLGSWLRRVDGGVLDYAAAGEELSSYVKEMGYTHVELMPITEYPDDESWGYQATGYFAPTARYGSPQQMKEMVNTLHKAGIGVILSWTPAYFPKDEHGLVEFDGGPCFESDDPLRNTHWEWGTGIFNFGCPQVQSFLIASALFWLEEYHMDGLRVDSVSSMLYLDYNREQWEPNIMGGRENLEAVEFLRKLNTTILTKHHDVLMIAEESSSWPLVTRPPYVEGLGFHYKWNRSWMRDTLDYISLDPLYRAYNHDKLTFGMFYAFSENFILPFSHDYVVNGKSSLLEKMPGSESQKYAGVRAFLGYVMSHPGKKLLFMGNEMGQRTAWDSGGQLDWDGLRQKENHMLQHYVKTLNHFYKETPPLWQVENSWEGFQWVVSDDNTQNIVIFRRLDEKENELVVVVNFAPVRRENYRFGVAEAKAYEVVLCSEDAIFGGEEPNIPREIPCEEIPSHNLEHSIALAIPPMCTLWLSPLGLKKRTSRIAGVGKKIKHRHEQSYIRSQ